MHTFATCSQKAMIANVSFSRVGHIMLDHVSVERETDLKSV